jgi:hypothetical protein
MGCIGPRPTDPSPDKPGTKVTTATTSAAAKGPQDTPIESPKPDQPATAPAEPQKPFKTQSTLAGRTFIKRQYEALLRFKDETAFRRFGLARHHKWREETEAGRGNQEFSIRERTACGDLVILAMEYTSSKSEETRYSRWVRPEIEAVIEDKPPPFLADPAKKPSPSAESKVTPPGPSAGGKTPALDDAIATLSGADDVRVIDTRQRKIRTWELVDLWRAGNKAYGGRLRVGGNAIVRPSGSGLYVQLTGGDGRALVRAWVPRVDSGPLARTTSEEVVPDLVIEGEVKPTDGGTVLLEFARVPQAGDPDEYTEYVLALEPRVAKPKQGVVRAAAAADTEAASDPEPDVGTSGAGAGGTSGGRLGGRPIGNFRLPSTGGKTVSVRGYTRKDGTFVRPHMRSAPRSGGRR